MSQVPLSRFFTKAAFRRESYEEGEGVVESSTEDKSRDHDEIVLRLKDGRTVRISNNTRLGKRLKALKGDRVAYHGHRVSGTDVVHKVHPNAHSRGGWLENLGKAASAQTVVVVDRENRRRVLKSLIEAIAYLTSIGAIPESEIEAMVRSRAPLINGQRVFYPEKTAAVKKADRDNWEVHPDQRKPKVSPGPTWLGRALNAFREANKRDMDMKNAMMNATLSRYGLITPEEFMSRRAEFYRDYPSLAGDGIPSPQIGSDGTPVVARGSHGMPLYIDTPEGRKYIPRFVHGRDPAETHAIHDTLKVVPHYHTSINPMYGPLQDTWVGKALGWPQPVYQEPYVQQKKDGSYVFGIDPQMHKEYLKDEAGNYIFDANGNKLYEYWPDDPMSVYESFGSRYGRAGKVAGNLVGNAVDLGSYWLAPWGRAGFGAANKIPVGAYGEAALEPLYAAGIPGTGKLVTGAGNAVVNKVGGNLAGKALAYGAGVGASILPYWGAGKLAGKIDDGRPEMQEYYKKFVSPAEDRYFAVDSGEALPFDTISMTNPKSGMYATYDEYTDVRKNRPWLIVEDVSQPPFAEPASLSVPGNDHATFDEYMDWFGNAWRNKEDLGRNAPPSSVAAPRK